MYLRFDFVQVPIFHPLFKRDHPSIIRRQGPPTRNDTVMKANDWAVLIVAKLSPWIQLESEDPAIRTQSEDVSNCDTLLLHFTRNLFTYQKRDAKHLLSGTLLVACMLLVLYMYIHLCVVNCAGLL